MISYRDVTSKNIVVTSFIERKIEVEDDEEKYKITCQYCGDNIDYWEDDYCEYDECTMCIKCFSTCMECGKYNEADYTNTLNGSEISRPICEDCHNKQQVTPIDITVSIDWIKNSRQNFNKAEKNKHHQGPFYISNWLSDKLCVGGYPKNKLELDTLLGAGIRVFVCLNKSFEKDRSYKYENDLPKDKNC